MKDYKTRQEMEAELNDIIAKCQHPEYFVDYWFDGELYFNPNYNYGLFVDYDHEYETISRTWFLNEIKLLFFVSDVSKNILYTSPDPIYQRIKELYIQNDVPIPRIFYRFEGHYL